LCDYGFHLAACKTLASLGWQLASKRLQASKNVQGLKSVRPAVLVLRPCPRCMVCY